MRLMIQTVCVLVVFGGVLFAQGRRTPSDGSAPDGVLAEVRALRAEINQAANAGIRTQLLVARLQLQERRVIGAAAELADTRSALAAVHARIAGERSRVRQLEDAAPRASDQGRLSIQQVILEAGTHIDQQHGDALALQERETQLLRAAQDAEAIRAHLGDQLDALERSLSSMSP